MAVELKRLTAEGIPAALEKAVQYRLLNQPWAAQSICLDILAVEPGHQHALRTLVLALTDRFVTDNGAVPRAREAVARLTSAYERAYFSGIILERLAKAQLDLRVPGAGHMAWEELREAMACYEKAETMRPPGDDDAILRWNTCARLINETPNVTPRVEEDREPVTGE